MAYNLFEQARVAALAVLLTAMAALVSPQVKAEVTCSSRVALAQALEADRTFGGHNCGTSARRISAGRNWPIRSGMRGSSTRATGSSEPLSS